MNRTFFISFVRHSSVILKNCSTRVTCSCSVLMKHEIYYPKREFSTTIIHRLEDAPDEFEYENVFSYPNTVVGNDPEKLLVVQELVREIDVLLQSSPPILFPKQLTKEHWQHLLTLKTTTDRIRYYRYLSTKEKLLENKQQQRAIKHNLKPPKPEKKHLTTNSPLEYGFLYNSILRRSFSKHLTICGDCKLASAAMFGPHLVIDCSSDYESHMTDREVGICARQLAMVSRNNRTCMKPFNIVHCNVNPSGRVMEKLQYIIPNLFNPETLFSYSEKNYTELFPADQLVYLSPHSDYELDSYDPNSIYIVGAIVDLIVQDPISLSRAKRDGLRTAKLPLDMYVNWCKGTRLLALDRVIAIMKDIRDGCSWQYAFRHISTRKLTYNFMDRERMRNNNSGQLSSLNHFFYLSDYSHLYQKTNDLPTADAEEENLDTDSIDNVEPSKADREIN